MRYTNIKKNRQARRQNRVRASIKTDAKLPRLSVFKSLKHVYVQVIDDKTGTTLVAASDYDIKDKSKRMDIADAIGIMVAEKCQAKDIKKVVFDRSSYKYHGVVRALAEAAREKGLEF